MKLLAAVLVLCLAADVHSKINLKSIISVNNVKEYKKVLKRNKNVLTLYAKDDKSALNYLRWMEDVAKEIKGKGTIVYINCGESKDAKKLCKKYSATPKPKLLKHYKDGEFNKDYDRKDTAKSLLNFMLDPTGDAPWEEDPAAKNVVQVSTEKELVKLRRKEKGPMLIMFYAPWCGYCKRLKPDYNAAATELKGKAVLAGMDVDKPDAFNVRYEFNITGFPTLIYFQNGEQKFNYAGKMDKEGLISWMQDPKPAEEKKEEEEEESWSDQAPEILHLTDATFDEALTEHASIVVMFYAPWCGHCKNMKPEFVDAAKQMADEQTPGKLAAMDCTKHTKVCKKFDIGGYPTVKYFENAEYKFKLNIRKKDEIVKFMKNPEEPPQPPPEELPWPEVSGPEILHLTDANFKDELKKKKHVLVMFYAPWCGHCKKAKPEIEKAAAEYTEDRKVWFAGVDCTIHKKSCEQFDVSGYPTFRYFLYGKKDFKYEGGRNTDAFIKFMKNPQEESAEPQMREPEWRDIPSGVVHLGDNDFDDFVKSHPSMLVMFYAPWCGHCKSMKPAYTEAANELLGTDHAIAAVDCTKNRKLASKYSISGYPSLRYFKDGQPTDYDSGRDKDSIVSYMIQKTSGEPPKKKLTGWAAENNFVHHLDSENFDSHLQEHSSVLIMFYAPWCGHCKKMKPDYADASHVINHEKRIPGSMAAVDCTDNADVCNRFEIRGYPTLKYFKNGVKTIDYAGGREHEDFINFMLDPKLPKPKPVEKDWSEEETDVVFLEPMTFDDFVEKEKSVLVMFYAPWCGHCKKMKPGLAGAAKIVNNADDIAGKIAAVDCVKHSSLAGKFEVNGYPTLKYFKDGKEQFKYRGPRTEDALVDFMKSPSEEDSSSNQPPQKTWAEESEHIIQLNDATFAEFVRDKDVLVAFYAPWCGHCTTMKEAFFETGKKLKEDNFPAVLAAVEATQNIELAKREGVKGYPTLIYYSNGKLVEKFEQQRTVQNMYAFLRSKIEGKERETRFDQEKWEDLPSSVEHLSEENFQTYLQKTQHVLVAFHVRWCKTCATMRTDLMQASSRLAGQMDTFGIAALNCDLYGDYCNEQGVKSFPTIKYYKRGEFIENYSASTTADDVTSFLQTRHKTEL